MVRYSEDQLSSFYRHVASYAGLPNDRRRHLYWTVPVAIALLAVLLRAEGLFWFGALSLVIGTFLYFAPDLRTENLRSKIRRYEAALASWHNLCDITNPKNPIAVAAPLRPSEIVYFCGSSERWVERLLGQTMATKTSGRMASAVVGGVVAGPMGAIVGSAGSKRTTGRLTNVYGLANIDQGSLIITNQRMMFLGRRDTLEVPYEKIVRFSVANAVPQYRVTAEYPGREAGEQYSVDRQLFALHMKRRAHLDFGVPEPPFPLPAAASFEDPHVALVLETKAP